MYVHYIKKLLNPVKKTNFILYAFAAAESVKTSCFRIVRPFVRSDGPVILVITVIQ